MPWQEYINLELAKLASRHLSGFLFLMIPFIVADLIAKHLPTQNVIIIGYIHICEDIVLFAGVTWLALFALFELTAISIKLIKGQKFLATFVG